MKIAPSFQDVRNLKLEIYKKVKIYPSDYDRPDRLEYKFRKRSSLFAQALRAKGWLCE